MVVGCDDGGTASAKPKAGANNQAAAKGSTPKSATPKPAAEAKTEVAPPAPAEVPSTEEAVEPAPPADIVDPVPTEVPAADELAAEDPEVDEPVADEPAADEGGAAVASSAEVGGISLGPDAELLRLVLAHDVVSRQPVDPATSFPAGQKVNLFVEARNQSGEEIVLRVAWEKVSNGRRSPPTNVRLANRKLHRTRAYKTIKKPGDYRCIVLGEGGEELAALPFTIEGE